MALMRPAQKAAYPCDPYRKPHQTMRPAQLPLHTKETNFQRSPFFDANDVLVECVDSQPFYRPVARKYEYPGRRLISEQP